GARWRDGRRPPAGRDREGDVAAPVERRKNERAQLGNVLDVAEDPACARVREDALPLLDVDDNDEPDAVQELGLVVIDGDDLGACGFQRSNLRIRAPDDKAATSGQVEARNVVLRRHTPTEWIRAPAR